MLGDMDYENVSGAVFATAIIPDGYFGATQKVGIALHQNKILVVTPSGFFRSGVPDCLDKYEAVWMIKNHPTAKHITNVDVLIRM